MRLKKGFLVAIEGIDGAGKTTQGAMLHEYLTGRGLPAILTKEPTDSVYGQKIKKLAQGERHLVKPREEYNLFIEDRKLHVTALPRYLYDIKGQSSEYALIKGKFQLVMTS